MPDNSHDSIEAAFNAEPTDLTRPLPMTTATVANSTTLADVQAKARRAKLIVGVLTTLASVALVVPFAPWNYIAAAVLYVVSIVLAWNTMTPAQIDALLVQLEGAGKRAVESAAKKEGGAR